MKLRPLAAAFIVAASAAIAAVSWGLLDDWDTAQVVTSVTAGASAAVLAVSIAVLIARRLVRLLLSTHKYARLSSERTAAMRPQIGVLSGSLREYARSSGRRARESRLDPGQRVPGGETLGTGGDIWRRRSDAPTMVVALGASGDDPALSDFIRSGERGDVVLVTDRADLIPGMVRDAAVEYVQLPRSGDGVPVAWLAVRLLELAAEHGAATLIEWPHARRVTKVQAEGIGTLSLVREEVLRELWELHPHAVATQDIAEIAERTAREAADRERSLVGQLTQATDRLQHAVDMLDQRSEKRQGAAVRELRSELNDVYRQIESLTSLYRIVDGSPTIPHLRGWAVSPDLAVDLLDLVLSGRSRSILELGSGASTVLFAMALERAGAGHVTSIDHDQGYAAQTQELLEKYGVAHRATVVHAPLVNQHVEGEEFLWYGIDDLELPDDVDLLFVDGPPEATGPRSRYPALPRLEARLAQEALIVLDDGRRSDEQEIGEAWSRRTGITSVTSLPHERRPVMLTFHRPAEP